MNNKERDIFRLKHMLESIHKITILTKELKDYKTFESRWVEQDAMIRNFEIIGEASNHVSDATKREYPSIKWHQIRGMRNLMSHEYFGIRLLTIWDTAVDNIPQLKLQIEQIILDLSKK